MPDNKEQKKERKKPMAKQVSARAKKLKLVDKVISAGLTSEEKIISMTPAEMVQLPDITTEELRLLCEMQDSVKSGTFFSYLCSE